MDGLAPPNVVFALVAAIVLTTPASLAAADDDGPAVAVDAVLEQAIGMAEILPTVEERAIGFAEIARIQARLGRAGAARAVLGRAAVLAKGPDLDPTWIYLRLAQTHGLLGAAAESRAAFRRAVETIHARNPKPMNVFTFAARQVADEGDISFARDLADEAAAAPADGRATMEAHIAERAARFGKIGEARVAIARAEAALDEAQRGGVEKAHLRGVRHEYALAQAQLAGLDARAGRADDARDRIARAGAVAADLDVPQWLPPLHAHLALARRAGGDEAAATAGLGRAIGLVGEVPDPGVRAEARAQLAILLAENGEPALAREVLATARVEADGLKVAPVSLLAAEAALGLWPEAVRLLKDTTFRRYRTPQALLALARSQACAGEAQAALDWVEGETTPALRLYGLIGLLQGMADRESAALAKQAR